MTKYKKIIIISLLLLTIFNYSKITNNIFSKTYSLFTKTKEISSSITVPGKNYCLNNGFNKLSDCMLIMENYSTSVTTAEEYIKSKGKADTTSTAPKLEFNHTVENIKNENGIISTSTNYIIGKSYVFKEDTGLFSIQDTFSGVPSEETIGYYTCGGQYTGCSSMYQILDYSMSGTTYKLTEANLYKYTVIDSFDSQNGLYVTQDIDGNTYFYRGNVKNNYVLYAGYIWRIIRKNGDGSIRLIYSGTSTLSTKDDTQIGTSKFNDINIDPTYIGYKYSNNFVKKESLSTATYSRIGDAKYYFADAYTFDETTQKFKLSGNKISGTWDSTHENAISKYPYTCFKTASASTCNIVYKIDSYIDSYNAKVYYVTYSSKDYTSTLNNEIDSTIKTKIETWYEENMLNKKDKTGELYKKYLADSIFCGDRSIASGTGYRIDRFTYYGARDRLITNKEPSLSICQDSDIYTELNGRLKYPIALISADEIALAGGVGYSVNTQMYLYTGNSYHSMTPFQFSSTNHFASIWYLSSTGLFTGGAAALTSEYGIRPVINLKSDILIESGDGTAEKPYVVALAT